MGTGVLSLEGEGGLRCRVLPIAQDFQKERDRVSKEGSSKLSHSAIFLHFFRSFWSFVPPRGLTKTVRWL